MASTTPSAPSGGTSGNPEGTRISRWLSYARGNPEDATAGLVVAAVALVTVLDLLGLFPIGQSFLAHAAVLTFSGLSLVVLADRQVKRGAAARDSATLAEIGAGLQQLKDQSALAGRGAQVAEVVPTDIGSRLDVLLDDATSWHFRGGSGRWQRARVLPVLAAVTERDTPYVMQILNPGDRDLCARYAAYRARQRTPVVRREHEGVPETVRDDLLSCIYAAAWYRLRSRVQSRVFLLSLFSPLRYDIGSAGLMITVADPRARGLYASRDGWYYSAVHDEISQACNELPEIVLPSDNRMYPLDWATVEASNVRAALAASAIRTTDGSLKPLLTNWSDGAEVDFARIAVLAFEGRLA